ncbi:MAG: glycerophosphodiester phosphodiesterase family protein [Bacteroidota bacterium]
MVSLSPPRFGHIVLLIALLAGAAGCYLQPRPLQPPPPPPTAALTAPPTHLRAFDSADALAAYLRWTPDAAPMVSAHRGSPAPGYPENSIATFERALAYAPALLETDVRLTADSVLVLLHDETLDRTTTGTGLLSETPAAALRDLRLRDVVERPTPHPIPTLAEALAWADGRGVLLLDIKRGVPPHTVVAAIREAEAANRVVVIVYTPEALAAFHALAPDLVYSVTARSPDELDAVLATGADPARMIAFTGVGEVNPAVIERLHGLGIRAQLGTFGALDSAAFTQGPSAYHALLDAGIDVIATDYVPMAAFAVSQWQRPAE